MGGSGGSSARCGDGIVGSGEQCDDGNATPADGCSPACTADPGPDAPVITRAAYYRLGPAMGVVAMQATYTGKYIAALRVDMLDPDGSTALADTNFDGVGDHAHIEFPIDPGYSFFGQFVLGFPVTTLVDEAKQQVYTLTDDSGRHSAPYRALEGPQPIRRKGEACDPGGLFDVCEPGTSCPPIPGATCG